VISSSEKEPVAEQWRAVEGEAKFWKGRRGKGKKGRERAVRNAGLTDGFGRLR
jgi:hypothetical protein